MSDKRAKFVELANKRVSNALKAIALIGNLSNRSTYEFHKEDLAKIFKALGDEIDVARQRFQGTDNNERSFRLD